MAERHITCSSFNERRWCWWLKWLNPCGKFLSTGLNSPSSFSVEGVSCIRPCPMQGAEEEVLFTLGQSSCVVDGLLAAWLIHSPFRHTALPQTTTPWLAAQATTWQMIGRCLCPFRWQPVPISLLVWLRSLLFDNNVLFDKTTPIYLINLPWK